jgi:hypothetical protein
MDYPGCVRGKKKALFFASRNNFQPGRHTIGVAREKLSKSLRYPLLESVVFLRFQRSPNQ